jgi:hypothetical protein
MRPDNGERSTSKSVMAASDFAGGSVATRKRRRGNGWYGDGHRPPLQMNWNRSVRTLPIRRRSRSEPPHDARTIAKAEMKAES